MMDMFLLGFYQSTYPEIDVKIKLRSDNIITSQDDASDIEDKLILAKQTEIFFFKYFSRVQLQTKSKTGKNTFETILRNSAESNITNIMFKQSAFEKKNKSNF